MVSGLVFLLITSAHILAIQGSESSYEWQSYVPGVDPIPANAIVAGYDADGDIIYISQLRVSREKIPSQLIPSKDISYAVHNGDIYKSALTQAPVPILCGTNYAWVSASLSNFPENAIPGGKTDRGDTLYVGRAEYKGAMIIGAVGPTRNALFASYDGAEVQWFGMYKVLVFNNIDQWTRATFDKIPADAVVGGYDNMKHEIYIGIVRVGNQVVPAQIYPEENKAVGIYSGGIVESDDFQVLHGGSYQWVSTKKGKIPESVVIAGRSNEGEPMFIGRVIYKRLMLLGTVLASERVLYINYLGKLRTVETGYDVLVRYSDVDRQDV